MSHIYEALRRAEAERKLEEHEDVDHFTAASPNSNAHTATITLEPLTAESYMGSAPPTPELNSSFLSDIPRRPWRLSIERLPAFLKHGPAVEQFRSLRSRLQEFRDLNKLKSILVSSGMPAEGKSFISANLAVSLARHKSSKVLLIDGDMRRSQLHHFLGCKLCPGLADYLAGKANIAEVMQYQEQTSGPDALNLSNLAFIPGGDGGDKAADLSGNKRFGELMAAVAPHFDWVIVDSSPVIPVSDAVGLARSCDAVLLVARAAITTFQVAQRAQSELKASSILGFVLNGVEKPPVMGGYYGYDSENA